ncbi:hypothetical protein MAR_024387, partial [Mya arenaria]
LPTTPLETRTITVSNAKRLTLPHYYHPQNATEWNKKQCLYHNADECLDPTLRRKCMALDAPFVSLSGHRYKNVYCLMCVRHERHDNVICETDTKLPEKGFEKEGVYSLINYDALNTVDKNIHVRTENKGECPKGYIPSPSLGICHLILCPEGMMLLEKGTCVYYIEWWYYDFYQISLTLTPTTGKVPISDITVIQNMNTKRALRYLHCPCMDVDWSSYWSVYFWNDTFGDVTALLITLNVEERGNGKEPKPFINRLRSCFERRWTITDWGLQQEFTAQLSQYHVAPYYFIGDAFLLLRKLIYRRIKSITKLFFCEQVFLSKDDVIRESVFKITLNETGRVLYRNEFSEAGEDFEMNPTGYTVCLEDFNSDWWLKHHALNPACTPIVRDLRSVYLIMCIVVWQVAF